MQDEHDDPGEGCVSDLGVGDPGEGCVGDPAEGCVGDPGGWYVMHLVLLSLLAEIGANGNPSSSDRRNNVSLFVQTLYVGNMELCLYMQCHIMYLVCFLYMYCAYTFMYVFGCLCTCMCCLSYISLYASSVHRKTRNLVLELLFLAYQSCHQLLHR